MKRAIWSEASLVTCCRIVEMKTQRSVSCLLEGILFATHCRLLILWATHPCRHSECRCWGLAILQHGVLNFHKPPKTYSSLFQVMSVNRTVPIWVNGLGPHSPASTVNTRVPGWAQDRIYIGQLTWCKKPQENLCNLGPCKILRDMILKLQHFKISVGFIKFS